MSKNKYTSINLEKLKRTLNELPLETQPTAMALYDELLFIQETLNKLKEQVRKEGAVEHFKQGKQSFLREHPALKSYNATIQRYITIHKQLLELLPKEEVQAKDDLLDFVSGKK